MFHLVFSISCHKAGRVGFLRVLRFLTQHTQPTIMSKRQIEKFTLFVVLARSFLVLSCWRLANTLERHGIHHSPYVPLVALYSDNILSSVAYELANRTVLKLQRSSSFTHSCCPGWGQREQRRKRCMARKLSGIMFHN